MLPCDFLMICRQTWCRVKVQKYWKRISNCRSQLIKRDRGRTGERARERGNSSCSTQRQMSLSWLCLEHLAGASMRIENMSFDRLMRRDKTPTATASTLRSGTRDDDLHVHVCIFFYHFVIGRLFQHNTQRFRGTLVCMINHDHDEYDNDNDTRHA